MGGPWVYPFVIAMFVVVRQVVSGFGKAGWCSSGARALDAKGEEGGEARQGEGRLIGC